MTHKMISCNWEQTFSEAVKVIKKIKCHRFPLLLSLLSVSKNQFRKMASLRSPSSPSDGYKRFSDDFTNNSVNNYGSNVTSKREAMIFLCTVAANYVYAYVELTIHFVIHLTFRFNLSSVFHLTGSRSLLRSITSFSNTLFVIVTHRWVIGSRFAKLSII